MSNFPENINTETNRALEKYVVTLIDVCHINKEGTDNV